MKKNNTTRILATSIFLFSISGMALCAENFSSSIKNEAPSEKDIKTAKNTLVWCTNNLQRIQQGKMGSGSNLLFNLKMLC